MVKPGGFHGVEQVVEVKQRTAVCSCDKIEPGLETQRLQGVAMQYIGKTAIMFALAGGEIEEQIKWEAAKNGFSLIKGRVGSMNTEKIFAAVETAAVRENLIEKDHYRQTHALYHATLEAFLGICRGQLGLGNMLRTVGLIFTVAKGPRSIEQRGDGEWLAVVLYGTIGAPIKGYEHETIGLGINHL